jgi:hypothetical protein
MLPTLRLAAFWFFLIGAVVLCIVDLFYGYFIAAVVGPLLLVFIGLFIMSPRLMGAVMRAPSFKPKKSDRK